MTDNPPPKEAKRKKKGKNKKVLAQTTKNCSQNGIVQKKIADCRNQIFFPYFWVVLQKSYVNKIQKPNTTISIPQNVNIGMVRLLLSGQPPPPPEVMGGWVGPKF